MNEERQETTDRDNLREASIHSDAAATDILDEDLQRILSALADSVHPPGAESSAEEWTALRRELASRELDPDLVLANYAKREITGMRDREEIRAPTPKKREKQPKKSEAAYNKLRGKNRRFIKVDATSSASSSSGSFGENVELTDGSGSISGRQGTVMNDGVSLTSRQSERKRLREGEERVASDPDDDDVDA
jgi:hypothetical protein